MNQVTIYTKQGCPYCAAAKEDLGQRQIAYIEHDVQADPSALQQMLALNGNRRHVPTIVQGDKVTVGFHGY